jgi:hypothetical protein
MIAAIDSSRAEILSEVRAKREMALRCARNGDFREQEYWLSVAGRMTKWIEHLEERDAPAPIVPERAIAGRADIDVRRGVTSVAEKVAAL